MNHNQLVPAKKEIKRVLQDESFREILAKLAAKRVNPDTIAEKAYFAISKNTKLLACDKESLLKAIVASALLGLDCTGTLGQGYLVPFGKECVFIAGYQGLIELARRSGHINRIEARAVFENDEFEVIFGSDQIIKHTPLLTGDRGKLVCEGPLAELLGVKEYTVAAEGISSEARDKVDGLATTISKEGDIITAGTKDENKYNEIKKIMEQEGKNVKAGKTLDSLEDFFLKKVGQSGKEE